MTPLAMALGALATYRATLLVTDDKITEPAREAVRTRLSGHGLRRYNSGDVACYCGQLWGPAEAGSAEVHVHVHRSRVSGWRGKALTLIGCPWCVSMWVGAAVVAAGYAAAGALWWEAPALVLSASGVTGLLYRAAHP